MKLTISVSSPTFSSINLSLGLFYCACLFNGWDRGTLSSKLSSWDQIYYLTIVLSIPLIKSSVICVLLCFFLPLLKYVLVKYEVLTISLLLAMCKFWGCECSRILFFPFWSGGWRLHYNHFNKSNMKFIGSIKRHKRMREQIVARVNWSHQILKAMNDTIKGIHLSLNFQYKSCE